MITFGKVGPVDIDEDMDALLKEMRMLGGEDNTHILNVIIFNHVVPPLRVGYQHQ